MTTSTLVLKLAGAALALVAVAVVFAGFWGERAPMDLDVWAFLIAMVCSGAASVLFIAADELKPAQPEPRRPT